MTRLSTLISVMVLVLAVAACGGGNQPEVTQPERETPDRSHHVGDADVIPVDISTYDRLFSVVGVDVYLGHEDTEEGRWTDWVGDLARDNGWFGIAFAPYQEAFPWAAGVQPQTSLATNTALADTVSWHGLLMGIGHSPGQTGNFDVVVGADASMVVSLGTMTGRLDFTNMQSWTSINNVVPNTGIQWRDGDLGYTISVSDNRFVNVAGDTGVVDGIFTGANHEGMAGTLIRHDLIGAFGGSQ